MSVIGRPSKFRCACCGKSFQGFVVMVCDECLDQRRDGETHKEMVIRLKAKYNQTSAADEEQPS